MRYFSSMLGPETSLYKSPLLIPAIASLLGLANSFRMLRLPDIPPNANIEGVGLG